MHFSCKNAALDRFLTETVEAFYELHPAAARAFEREVDDDAKHLIKPSGMSTNGTLLNYGKIPAHVYAFIKREYRRRFEDVDFFANFDNYARLCKIWKTARVRRKPTNMLIVPSLD